MDNLLLVALAGFLASMVDGALGMGFGPTSSSILLASGLSPAAASTTVNLAKVASGLAAGVSHWRLRNIDRRLVLRLALPGAVGALIGTYLLTNVDSSTLRPILAVLLIAVGLRILFRFSLPVTVRADDHGVSAVGTRGVEATATAGGITNGLVGAWGPVVTPYLLHRGLAPRLAVGCVNTAEVAVAIVASGSLLTNLSSGELEIGVVVAMLIGGVAGAPLAAWVVRFMPPRIMGLLVAGLLLVTQSRELAGTGDYPGNRWLAYGVALVAVTLAMARPRLMARRARGRDESPEAAAA